MNKILMMCLDVVFKSFLGMDVTRLSACLILLFTLSPAGAHQILEGSFDEDAEKQQMEQVLHYAEQVNAINVGLAGAAKAMAKALSDKKFRQFVRQQTARSRNAEQILEAKSFFQKATRTNRSAPGIQELHQRMLKLSAQAKEAGLKLSEETGEVDIYFPVAAHRKRWRGGQDLLVAFVPLVDDMRLSEIYAWSVKDKKRVILDTREPPATPVLVIALTEKLTYATRKPPPPTDVGSVKGPEPKDKPKSDNSYFGVSHIKLWNDREPWFMGNPEIYAYHIQLGAPGWNNKHGFGDCQVVYQDFFWINATHHMYYIWENGGTRYFDSRYSDRTNIKFFERDVGQRYLDHVIMVKEDHVDWTNTSPTRVCIYEKRRFDDFIASLNRAVIHGTTGSKWKSLFTFGPDHQSWGCNTAIQYMDETCIVIRKIH